MLGPLEVWAAGHRIEAGPPQRRAVLAALAVEAGRPVSTEMLIDRVWGDKTPAAARAAVHANITLLRRMLGSVNAAGEQPPVALVRRGGGYVLQIGPQGVDLLRFRGLVATAREGQCSDVERATLLHDALTLWHGPALADLGGEWPGRMRESWGLQRLDAAVDWARTELRLGHQEQVISRVRVLLADHPLAEPLAVVLIEALAATGRGAEALDCYAATRTRLADQLGADPGAELQDLHQAILRGGQLLGQPRADVVGGPVVPRQLPAPIGRFVGRTAELKQLTGRLDVPATPDGTVVISAIGGTSGIGKTALAVHWARRVADRFPDGQLYVNLRGFDPGAAPMDPADAIRGFLDAFEVAPQRIPVGVDAQAALYRSLLSGKRVLVVLDNARDTSHVRPLLPGSPGCVVVVTSRNRLAGLVTAEGAHPLTLELLSAGEAVDLLTSRLGAARVRAEPEAVDEIVTRCARLPLALAVVAARAASHTTFPLAALAADLREAQGGLDTFDGGDPATDLRTVFSWSYEALSTDAARLFRLLGLHPGPDIAAPAAASLAGAPLRRVRASLAELSRAHLVAEDTPNRFSFHDLLRAYATELVHTLDSDSDRRAALYRVLDHYLHTAHAAALVLDPYRHPITPDPVRPGVAPEMIADRPAALTWFAAEQLVLLAALDRAARAGCDRYTWQLAWALADILEWRGYWEDWATTQHAALAAAQRLDDPAGRAHAHRHLSGAHMRLGHLDNAHDHLLRALELDAGRGDNAGQAYTHRSLAKLFGLQGLHAEALSHARQALDLCRAAGHRPGEARALYMVGWKHAQLGDHEQAHTTFQQALVLLQQVGDRYGQAFAWDGLGFTHHHLGHHQKATTCYHQALSRYRDIGDRYVEAETLTRLGETRHAAGNHDSAKDAWRQALAIYTELGHPAADDVRTKLHHLGPRRVGSPS